MASQKVASGVMTVLLLHDGIRERLHKNPIGKGE
jgi:hypothetical protein